MSIADLSSVLKIFRGTDLTPEEEKHLFREVLLMTLARASSSDANIAPVEVETVQAILEKTTGKDISAASIRVAAASDLYETASLEKFLSSCGRKLDATSRVTTVQALAEVIKSDTRVTSREVEFFDMVARALAVTPAELAGLVVD
ncbi:MAG: TerB family tellurite resistance protein [Gammaproteobacteria bacterium]|nr:TerB family tellurite resistance protein [Gammaproteobacteria bacterium]MCZ6498344.1 TerB family tellurite resistance protein [Gammaproteobacteria bacterium]